MTDDRRSLKWTLSAAAKILPPAERQKFREFLNDVTGQEPHRRKVHSWKRKRALKIAKAKKRSPRRRLDRQLRLPLDD